MAQESTKDQSCSGSSTKTSGLSLLSPSSNDPLNFLKTKQLSLLSKASDESLQLSDLSGKSPLASTQNMTPVQRVNKDKINFSMTVLVSSKKREEDLKTKYVKWTAEEENLLVSLCCSKLQKKWLKIAEIIKTKSPSQCSYKYTKLKHRISALESHLSSTEDILLSDQTLANYFEDQKRKNTFPRMINRKSNGNGRRKILRRLSSKQDKLGLRRYNTTTLNKESKMSWISTSNTFNSFSKYETALIPEMPKETRDEDLVKNLLSFPMNQEVELGNFTNDNFFFDNRKTSNSSIFSFRKETF